MMVRSALINLAGVVTLSFVFSTCSAQGSPSNQTNQHPEGTKSFSVIRIKLSPDSEADDWGIGIRGRNFWAVHATTNELIEWACGLNVRQIEHGPDWLASERFDVDGLPETDTPISGDQYRTMLKAALAERFALKFHPSEKVLPAYVISVAEGGVKASKVEDQNAHSSWGIHRGWLSITNMTFDSVAKVMQRTVFDRPVLDQTGLKDRYSFLLRWRADDTQFSQMQGMDVPQESGTEDVDDIYTSARKQLGIKIEAKRASAPTIVIETVSRPSAN